MSHEVEPMSFLPTEIREGFFGDKIVSEEQLGGGMINTNIKVTQDNEAPVIVQQVSHIFKAEPLSHDIVAVTDHLRANGWEAPSLIAGHNGELTQYEAAGEPDTTDNEPKPWRAMTFIESDGKPNANPEDLAAMNKCGALLAKWHVTMQQLDYTPQHTLEHFHDTPYHYGVFTQLYNKMPNEESATLSREVLKAMTTLPTLPDYGDQMLHGDPRTDNMLFRDGQPFTFIDFDTVMKGKVWIDLGDMLRSLAENAVDAGQPVPIAALEAVAESYRVEAHPEVDPSQFKGWAMTSMKLIAGELTMRFLNDYAEPGKKYFALSQDVRLDRAKVQWQIFNSVELKGAE